MNKKMNKYINKRQPRSLLVQDPPKNAENAENAENLQKSQQKMQKSIGRDAKMQPLRLSPLPPNQGLSPLPPTRNKCAQRWIPVSLPMLFCIFSVDFHTFSAFSAFLLCWGEWGRGPGVVSSIYTNAFLHFWVGFLWVFCIFCIFCIFALVVVGHQSG